MLTFLHCYTDELWKGYEINGLIGKGFGVRFPQSKPLPDNEKFNVLAAKNGKLYDFVKQNRCPLYIDRLQGGIYIDDYEYDSELLGEYERILGDDFLGLQMHEWLSNYRGDVVNKLGDLPAEEWTEQGIEAHIRKKYSYGHILLESMTVGEMARAGKPTSWRDIYRNMTDIYRERLQKYKKLVPVDSYYMMYPFEAELGAKIIMPEVGAQTRDMRLQMSFARGVTKAYGIKLGAYYEPWGGEPFSACNYHKNSKNEWNLYGADFPFETKGENGGSSRSLQWRMLLYAYLCGAEYISEEWGGYNTFLDCEEYKLSEYGLVKKRFLDFVDKYSDIGEKITPVAVVISNDLPCYTIGDKKDMLFGFPLEGDEAALYSRVRDGVDMIFSNACPMVGGRREINTLTNSRIPDAVDMLNEGDGSALENYKYLVDLTGDAAFAQRHNNCISPEAVAQTLRGLLPCRVEGEAHYLINKCGDGGYYLTVFNHSGVVRSLEEGEYVLPEATHTVAVELDKGHTLTPLEGSKNITFEDGKYYITLEGGDYFFGRF